MDIIFICGSLEPGKNGVGDYTRRLCGELIKQNKSVAILSYFDKDVKEDVEEYQSVNNLQVLCYRLSNKMVLNDRTQLAKSWLDDKKPKWLSLQFVPYSFQEKGMPFTLDKALHGLSGKYRWHIMFHELWIGMNQESNLKNRIIGRIQKFIIIKLIRNLNPDIIHTQTQLYQKQLLRVGFSAKILPLFTNIPNISISNLEIKSNGITDLNLPENFFVIFGNIHRDVPITNFLEELNAYKNAKPKTLILLGRNGAEQQHWINTWHRYGFKTINLGSQSVATISAVLQIATFGITTTPMALVEKSGSVIAMLNHGLSVICMSRKWSLREFNIKFEKTGVTEYKYGNIDKCLKKSHLSSVNNENLELITQTFLNSLNN